jgi:transcriptional regulator with XRE-family HTH domain
MTQVERSRHPVDVHIGQRLRCLRTLAGLTQAALAARIDVTSQQIRKYETGGNQLSSRRLYELAEVMGKRPECFFEGYGEGVRAAVDDALTRKHLELVRDFRTIGSRRLRDAVTTLVKDAARVRRPQARAGNHAAGEHSLHGPMVTKV